MEEIQREELPLKKRNLMARYLDLLEKIGNKMPHPFIMFAWLALILIVLSAVLSAAGVHAIHPQTGEMVEVFNFVSGAGIQMIFSTLISNFTGFAPLGMVLTIMLSIGIADHTGLMSTVLRSIVLSVPKKAITPTLVFAAVLSSVAADAGYVVLIPLGAALFASMGRHPIAGLAAAFAGVAGGFGANVIITPGDALLGGISEAAAQTVYYGYNFNIIGNWFFMIVSTFLIVAVGTYVTEKIVEPRLGKYEGDLSQDEIEQLTPIEKKGMRLAGLSILLTGAVLSLLIVPSWGPLRGEGAITASPFFTHLVAVLFVLFLVPGIVYGKTTKQIHKAEDVVGLFTKSISDLSGYIVLVFIAAQFVALFSNSNMGVILAIRGGYFLENVGLTGFFLILAFMILSAFVNLFIGSASAQWLLFAPIFVPMFMNVGFTPEFTQLAYRVGDSITNPVSPLLSYLALIITFAKKYDKKSGLGSIISTMMPYSIFLGIFWFALVAIWMMFNLPIGPDARIFMP
jgi:aminobenzoyl-glutamate transport protein